MTINNIPQNTPFVNGTTLSGQSSGAFLAITGACAFDGLIICLNLVKHGLNYDKLKKLEQLSRKGKF